MSAVYHLANRVVVVGAGVLGLTSALVLAEQGFDVVIVARDDPDDLNSQAFASPWAGANWHSFGYSPDLINPWETITLAKMISLIPTGLVHYLPSVHYHLTENEDESVETAWYNKLLPSHKVIPKSELPKGYASGSYIETISLSPAKYLPWLWGRLKALGVKNIKTKVDSLASAVKLVGGDVGLVVNATGLGAKSLLDVLDDKVMPIRGQTVLVRAPWMKQGYSIAGYEDGSFMYMIPRPDGTIVCGGTFGVGEWDTSINTVTAQGILRHIFEACPAVSRDGTLQGIDVISHNVGLRPAREGGPRVELEQGVIKNVGVVHAYGIGPAGYQSSWGIAENVLKLAREHFGIATTVKSKL